MVHLIKNFNAREASFVNLQSNPYSKVLEYDPETRTGRAMAHVETLDSYGTVIEVKGMQIHNLDSLLFNHRDSAYPIGSITRKEKTTYAGRPAVEIAFKLAERITGHDEPEIIHSLLSQRALTGISLGYDIKNGESIEIEEISADDYRARYTQPNGTRRR